MSCRVQATNAMALQGLLALMARHGLRSGRTALSAALMHKMPVWAALTAANLAKWRPPSGVEDVHVFGDNDLDYKGQVNAYIVGHKLANSQNPKYHVNVAIPDQVGRDWNNVLVQQ